MTRFAVVLLIVLAGCYSVPPGGPSAPNTDTTTQAVVFERLAVAIESGEFSDSTQRAVTVITRALTEEHVKPPAGFDDALTPWLTNHEPTDAECKELAKQLRALK